MLQPLSATAPTVITTPADAGITLSAAQRNLISLTVQPGSLVDDAGNPVASPLVGVAPVPPDIVRDMLPPGILEHSFDITIQVPGGALFTQPATLTLPNVFNLAPGEKTYILSFDHTTGRLVIDGTATASADGLSVTTDPGQGITKPGWHGMTPPTTKTHTDPAPPVPPPPPPMGDEGDPNVMEQQPTAVLDKVTLAGDVDFNKTHPITIAVLANDVPGDEPLDPGSVTVTQPSHGTATVQGGVVLYQSKDGKSSDSFSYTVGDGEYTVGASVVIEGDCPAPIPLEVDGGDLSIIQPGKLCKVTSSQTGFTLTNINGTQPLLFIPGTGAGFGADATAVISKTDVALSNATVEVGFGTKKGTVLLRNGAADFMAGTAAASGVTSQCKVTDPLIAGLSVAVTDITLKANEIDVSGSLALGDAFSGLSLNLGGVSNSTPATGATGAKAGFGASASGVVITADGATIGGAAIMLPDQQTMLGGVLSIKASGLAFTYDAAKNTGKVQGKFQINRLLKDTGTFSISGGAANLNVPTASDFGLVADFSGDNYVLIDPSLASGYAVVGSFEIQNAFQSPAFSIPSLKVFLDTTKSKLTASGSFKFGLGPTSVTVDLSGTGILDANGSPAFDGLSVSITKQIIIPDTPLFLQQFGGALAG